MIKVQRISVLQRGYECKIDLYLASVYVYMQELYDELRVKGELYLPIYKVDDMMVNSRLYSIQNGWYEHPYTFYLELCLNTGYKYLDTGSTFEEFTQMIEGLKDIRFDVLSGEFINPSKLVKPRRPPVVLMPMFHHPNIEMEYKECCVCIEFTVTKTPCKHTLCGRCQEKMTKMICPLCRASLCDNVD
jgi:hypothetical protein